MVRISVELPDEIAEALARAASELNSTREALLVEGARNLVARDDDTFPAFAADREPVDAFIAEGEADVATGRVVPAEQVFAELAAIIAGARKRQEGSATDPA